YGSIAARIAGVRAAVSTLTGLGHLFTTHTVKTRVLRWIVAGGLRFSFRHQNHRVIFQNPYDRDCLLARTNMPGDRAVLIKGSGVNLSLFTPEPEPDGLPVVLMASRLLWEKGDGEALTGAIAQLIENAPLRAAMGKRGREIVGIEFSLDQVIDANLAIYRFLLASIPRPRIRRNDDFARWMDKLEHQRPVL